MSWAADNPAIHSSFHKVLQYLSSSFIEPIFQIVIEKSIEFSLPLARYKIFTSEKVLQDTYPLASSRPNIPSTGPSHANFSPYLFSMYASAESLNSGVLNSLVVQLHRQIPTTRIRKKAYTVFKVELPLPLFKGLFRCQQECTPRHRSTASRDTWSAPSAAEVF